MPILDPDSVASWQEEILYGEVEEMNLPGPAKVSLADVLRWLILC